MIYAVGDVSGAHLNPAVTLGFFVARRFNPGLIAPYVACQCGGAILASATLRMLFGDHATLGATLPAGSNMQSFVLESILTFFLMFVILRVSTGAKEKGITAGIAVGRSWPWKPCSPDRFRGVDESRPLAGARARCRLPRRLVDLFDGAVCRRSCRRLRVSLGSRKERRPTGSNSMNRRLMPKPVLPLLLDARDCLAGGLLESEEVHFGDLHVGRHPFSQPGGLIAHTGRALLGSLCISRRTGSAALASGPIWPSATAAAARRKGFSTAGSR